MTRFKEIFILDARQKETIQLKMLNWASQFGIFLFLDSNGYYDRHRRHSCLLAAGATEVVQYSDAKPDFHRIARENGDWWFGHITYDYKNHLEPRLHSQHPVRHDYPSFYFFRPAIVCAIDKEFKSITIESVDTPAQQIFNEILSTSSLVRKPLAQISFRQRMDQSDYIKSVQKLRAHIAAGDCYEINFCSEGYAENVQIDPLQTFLHLNHLSPAPFAAYYRLDKQYMICASPERYLQKKGKTLRSQPIKGTAPRNPDPILDKQLKDALQRDIKERAENVMITDLVRNDLARSCKPGSIQVEELMEIYSYPQVHQMISTIVGKMEENLPFTQAIQYSFPMGSMTGAPKIRVMELIEQYETARRELFSGTVGYIDPDQNFDFNVVIRSLFFNEDNRYLSYQTGGAITYDSVPEKEWEERRLKAWAMERIFG